MRSHPHAESLRKLKAIKILENGEPLVSLQEYPLQLHPDVLPYLRHEVAERLVLAQSQLPKDYRLLLIDGLHAPSLVQEKWEDHYKKLEYEHPFWPAAFLRRATSHAFTPHNHRVPPAHTTGGAIDVILTDTSGKIFDLVPPLTDWNLGHVYSNKVPVGAQHRRRILLEAMEAAGFSNYPHAYWHYSYGDSGWAARQGHKVCFYGPIHGIDDLKKAVSENETTETILEITS